MKLWFPPAVILAGILLFSLWDANQMQDDTHRWCTQLQLADQLAVAEDWVGALEALEDSYLDWQSRWLYLHIVSSRDVADNAESMYLRAMAFAKTEEITEFRAELSDLQNQLRVLRDMESFKLHMFF